jgi:hypothetical protein
VNHVNAITTVRLYLAALVILMSGWCINLLAALHHPTVDWWDAAGAPALVLVFITLTLLLRARSRLAADPSASIGMGAVRYVLAGFATAGLIVALVLGYSTKG